MYVFQKRQYIERDTYAHLTLRVALYSMRTNIQTHTNMRRYSVLSYIGYSLHNTISVSWCPAVQWCASLLYYCNTAYVICHIVSFKFMVSFEIVIVYKLKLSIIFRIKQFFLRWHRIISALRVKKYSKIKQRWRVMKEYFTVEWQMFMYAQFVMKRWSIWRTSANITWMHIKQL